MAQKAIDQSGNFLVDGAPFHGGQNLIQKLHLMQNPDIGNDHLKEKFETVNNFLKEITENPSARIEIPKSEKNIIVEMDGKRLPLQNLGSGIEELIIIAAACTSFENQVVVTLPH